MIDIENANFSKNLVWPLAIKIQPKLREYVGNRIRYIIKIGTESRYFSVNNVTISGSAIKIKRIVAGKKTKANLLMLDRYNFLISDSLPSLCALDIKGVTTWAAD